MSHFCNNHRNSHRNNRAYYPRPLLLSMAVAACFSTGAIANPVAPTVVNGTASFNQAGNVLTVTNSNGAAINWNSFSIAAGETTRFVQPSASSSVLNRVLGGDPSSIYGTLSSNGRVWLVNPAGIMVGPSGRIDVAGFVASTLNVSTADFLANKLGFNATPGAGNVVNQGEITTPSGGAVYLVGTQVTNEGIITTPQGETILAAGQTVSLIDTATPGVKVEITGAAGDATNLGTIVADAGRIGIAGVIVRNSGTLNASSAVSEGGKIFLRASQDAYVDGSGRIITTGTTGGRVEVLGERVAVMDNASIDASGINGGGSILVGGDYQGKNPAIQNASVTYFGPDATLKADAQNLGAGGAVIVWADDTTRAYGTISARGGANGGDGGFVETSGKRYLAVDGIHVDTRAPQGTTGNWLLDPDELAIFAGEGTDIGILGGPAVFTTGSSSSTIYSDGIESALTGTNVTLQTGGGGGNGSITATGVTINSAYGTSLTLAAYGGGSATGNINITNSSFYVYGGMTLLAGWDGTGFTSGDVILNKGDINISGSQMQSWGGVIELWAGHDINLSYGGSAGTWVQGAGMDVFAGHDLKLTGGNGGISVFNDGGGLTGFFGPGVMLMSIAGGAQTINVGNAITLTAGSANNAYAGDPMYGGSVIIRSEGDQTIDALTIKLAGGAAGHDNAAIIQSTGSNQTININGVSGLLEVKAGSGDRNLADVSGNTQIINFAYGGALNVLGGNTGIQNIASIQANSSQTINASGVAITLTGGSSGGDIVDDQINDAAIEVSSGNRTVYAGSITINGGSATYGGAGFGSDGGGGIQTFHITGNLTMNGGSSANSDFLATPVYIGSEYGGGTINVNVGGNIILNGGSSLGGGVLIGGVDDSNGPTSVTLNAGGNITATGNTGGVWLGVKDLAGIYGGSTVTLRAGADASGNPGGNGGNITTSGLVGIQVDGDTGDISIGAYESSAGAYGGVTLGASTAVYGSAIEVAAHGDNAIAGSLMATSGGIDLYAGGGQRAGNLILSSTSNLGANHVSLNAEAGTAAPYGGGSITQAGSMESYGSGIDMYADRNITINGSVKSAAWIYLLAGDNGTDAYGGNLVLGATSNLEAMMGYVQMYATAGTMTSYGGNITQAGSLTGGYGSGIYMAADRDININGSVASDGPLYLQAGYNNTNAYGGNLTFGAGSVVMADGAEGYAYSGAERRGDIVQYGGSINSDSGVEFYADGSVKLNGRVETPWGYIYAGLDNAESNADFFYNSFYGGNIEFGAGSAIYSDEYIEMIANRGTGDDTTGNVKQFAGGILSQTSEGEINITTAGHVDLLGSVILDGGSGLNIETGINLPESDDFQDKHVTINSLQTSLGYVDIEATGPIFANTQDVGSIYAEIYNGNSGGIVINNSGAAQPSSVELYDSAATNRSITFTHTGSDLALDSSYYFVTADPTEAASGSILVAAPSNSLTYSSVGDLYGDSVILAAGNQLNIEGSLYNSYGDLALIAPTVNVMDYVYASGTLNVAAGTLNNMTSSGTLSAGTDLTMIAGNINGTDEAHFQAGNNINAVVANNITLLDGAHFHAGNDINLALAGAGSTVSMTNGSFMHANAPSTIHIDFAARNSGGIFINGVETTTNASDGTGFFIGSGYPPTPAVPGAGLEITYANPANQAILAIFDSNSQQSAETEEERQRRLQQTDDDGESNDPADKPVAQCS